jgi:drug/metabolite transporter (DMT)-like permease
MGTRGSHLLAVFAVGSAAAIWGSAFPATKYLQDAGLSVGALLSLRFVIGAAGLLVGCLIAGVRFDRRSVVDGFLAGLVLAALFWLQTDGLRSTTTTKNAFITGLYVIFTPAVALLFGDRLRPIHGVAALIAGLGLLGLVFRPGERFGGWNFGDTETLLNAILIGLHIVLMGHFTRRSNAWVLAFVQVAVVMVLSLAMTQAFPATYGFRGGAGLNRIGTWVSLGYMGLFATTLGFWVQSHFQSRLGATETGILMGLEPVWATLLSVSGFVPGVKDHLEPRQWLGAGLMFAAAMLAELGPRLWRSRRTEEEAIG